MRRAGSPDDGHVEASHPKTSKRREKNEDKNDLLNTNKRNDKANG